MIINLEEQKKHFKNHIAKLTDYGDIKMLDFKAPDTAHYRIRFLFEEDYCRLHISGDLGELIATNYTNMTYEKFKDFADNVGYFMEKIDCHSRDIYVYDEDKAVKDIKEYIEEYDAEETLMRGRCDFETIDDVIGDILEDFDEDHGIGSKGYGILSEGFSDAWEFAGSIGKKATGILDLYMLAFKLATKQLKESQM